MAAKLYKNQLKKILDNRNGVEQKKHRTPADRLKDVLEFNKDNSEDKIIMLDNQVIISLKNIRLLSNNDMLRVDNRKLTSYKNLCKKRITSLVEKIDIKLWKDQSKDQQIKIEYIYSPSHGRKMDTTDGITGAFKYLIDGLTISNLIEDDDDKHVPIAISKQIKGNNEIYILLTIIDDIEKYYSKEFKDLILTVA